MIRAATQHVFAVSDIERCVGRVRSRSSVSLFVTFCDYWTCFRFGVSPRRFGSLESNVGINMENVMKNV